MFIIAKHHTAQNTSAINVFSEYWKQEYSMDTNKQFHAFNRNDALGTMDAVALAEAIRSKQVSVSEVVEAAIKRAEQMEPHLNAIVVKTFEQALVDAKHNTKGFFGGIPTFVKDNEKMKGLPTQFGTGAFASKLANKNSKYVEQFLGTGMIALGKTTLPEFGLICSTENPAWGITRNPWNVDHTPGGSSSGSAAMVASGVVPVAMANDGAGSTRIPASCTGLVGLKPTRNRLRNVEGTEVMPINIVHEGILTRSVRDTIAFYTEAEKLYYNKRLPPIGSNLNPVARPLKIVWFENLPQGSYGHQDEDTRKVLESTALLLEQMGHKVECRPFPIAIQEMAGHFLNYYGFMAFAMRDLSRVVFQAKVDKHKLENFTNGLSNYFKKNALRLPQSLRLLKNEGKKAELLYEEFDISMTPVVSHEVPPIGYFDPALPYEEISKRAVGFASFTGLQNVTGAPAISLPLGFSSKGLPIGVHFMTKNGNDRALLEFSLAVESAKPFKHLYHGND